MRCSRCDVVFSSCCRLSLTFPVHLYPGPQVAASPEAIVVSTSDVPAEALEKERAIEMEKEDLKSKPEAIRCVA